MNTDLQLRALEEFERLHDLAPESRDEAMRRLEPELRSQVEQLCAASEESTGPVGESLFASFGSDQFEFPPGTVIDEFTIKEKIGEGGFGEVYLAEQTQPMRRRVALKIIKRGMDSRAVVTRFEAERQALAMMDHPNVARVFGGGNTTDGQPYFVMEYVDGDPIPHHCDARQLSIRQRIELFCSVCEAVQHAHQKGIIHRDIKPANVLVEFEGDRPTPKVIDFGIARALDQSLTDATLVTETGRPIGTPLYMSPEQIEAGSGSVDARSDVYALGVLLYELLTGVRPFEGTSFFDIQRRVAELDPPPASARVRELMTSTPDSFESAAQSRSITPTELISGLRGDLDWILAKSLAKDPRERYQSASAFAEDLNRSLRHEPVQASPPSSTYQFRKFVRRHRASVTGASIAVAAIVLGLGASIFGLVRASRAAEAAITESEISDAVVDFLNADLLAAVRPSVKQGEGLDVSMRQVVDAASERIEKAVEPGGKFNDKPLVEAAIRSTLATVYEHLEQFPLAEHHASRALNLNRSHRGRRHEDTLAAADHLASILFKQSRNTEADAMFQEALELSKIVHGPTAEDTLITTSNLGLFWTQSMGKHREAEALLAPALAAAKKTLAPDSLTIQNLAHNLAISIAQQGRLDDAEPYFLFVYETRLEYLPENDPLIATSLHNLGLLYRFQGRLDDAIDCATKALEIQRAVFDDTHVEVTKTLSAMSALHHLNGDLPTAISLQEEVLQARRLQLGDAHTLTIDCLQHLAALCEEHGDTGKAMEYAERYLSGCHARAILEDATPVDHARYAQALMSQDAVEEHDLSTALEFAQRAADRSDFSQPRILGTLARALHMHGDVDAAGDLLDRADALVTETDPAGQRELATLRDELGLPASEHRSEASEVDH